MSFIKDRPEGCGAHWEFFRRTFMGSRLYVGNLGFNTTQMALEEVFAACGEVREVEMPTDRETGQFRGFAFVTMGTEQHAQWAISFVNGTLLNGRPLRVNEAQERLPRETPPLSVGRGGHGGGGGGRGRGGRDRY
jgi:RNA recognition motif-containing protein